MQPFARKIVAGSVNVQKEIRSTVDAVGIRNRCQDIYRHSIEVKSPTWRRVETESGKHTMCVVPPIGISHHTLIRLHQHTATVKIPRLMPVACTASISSVSLRMEETLRRSSTSNFRHQVAVNDEKESVDKASPFPPLVPLAPPVSDAQLEQLHDLVDKRCEKVHHYQQ